MTTDMTSPAAKPTRAEVAAVVRDYLSQELRIDATTIADDAILKELSGADSVRLLRVMSRIERHWNAEFDDEHIFGVKTLDELVSLIIDHAVAGG